VLVLLIFILIVSTEILGFIYILGTYW